MKAAAEVDVMHAEIEHDCVVFGRSQGSGAQHHGEALEPVVRVDSAGRFGERSVLDLAATLERSFHCRQVAASAQEKDAKQRNI